MTVAQRLIHAKVRTFALAGFSFRLDKRVTALVLAHHHGRQIPLAYVCVRWPSMRRRQALSGMCCVRIIESWKGELVRNQHSMLYFFLRRPKARRSLPASRAARVTLPLCFWRSSST